MLVILFLLSALTGVQAGQGESPREIARVAQRAFEHDSAGPIASSWAARLSRDSSDRAAALGLATLAALRHDSLEAHEAYRRLITSLPSSDPYRIQALIGLGTASSGKSRSILRLPDSQRRPISRHKPAILRAGNGPRIPRLPAIASHGNDRRTRDHGLRGASPARGR
jgi:hypothetical protein